MNAQTIVVRASDCDSIANAIHMGARRNSAHIHDLVRLSQTFSMDSEYHGLILMK